MSHTITLHWAIDIIHTSEGDFELDEFVEISGVSREDLINSATSIESISIEDELDSFQDQIDNNDCPLGDYFGS